MSFGVYHTILMLFLTSKFGDLRMRFTLVVVMVSQLKWNPCRQLVFRFILPTNILFTPRL